MSVRNPIIPPKQSFYGRGTVLDTEAICVFAALGFFLDRDTFWTDRKTVPAASECVFGTGGEMVGSEPYFKWHSTARNIDLAAAVDEFTELFESIVRDLTKGKNVILPLSGGLDSRTLAAALANSGAARTTAYSYSFAGGHDETVYARQIAQRQNFPFFGWLVEAGYLWPVIDDLALINGCYSEFTHPRQMAFADRYAVLGDAFALGHWGDVLFDGSGVADDLAFDGQVDVVLKKIVKKGGLELGSALWQGWGLDGEFQDYLRERVRTLLATIDIPHSANARIRAFKSMFWATRWTSVNLSVFESAGQIALPYFDDRMCEFICTLPEQHLAGRKIQIEYLKRRAPRLAAVAWQDRRPFNLYNYEWDAAPWNVPYRIYKKATRSLRLRKFIQRNWELQFLGSDNDAQLRKRLFDEKNLTDWIPEKTIRDIYNKFATEDPVYFAHSVSMLLTLSLFCRHFMSAAPAYAGRKADLIRV